MSGRSSHRSKAKVATQSTVSATSVMSKDVSIATKTDTSNGDKLLGSDSQHAPETQMENEQSASSAPSAAGEKTRISDRSTKKRLSTGNSEAQGDNESEPAEKRSRKKDSQRVPATVAKKSTPEDDETLEHEGEREMETDDDEDMEQDNTNQNATGNISDFKNTHVGDSLTPSTTPRHHLPAERSDKLQSANAVGDSRSRTNFSAIPEPRRRFVAPRADDVIYERQPKVLQLQTYRSECTSTPSPVDDTMPELPEQKHEHSCKKLIKFSVLYCVAAVFVVLLVSWLNWAKLQSMKSGVNDDMPVSREVSFGKLRAEFPSQTPRLWRIMESATFPIIEEDKPTHPAVILLVAAKGSESVAECLARRYATLVTETLKAAAHATFNCETYTDSDPDDAKRQLDSVLSRAFDAGSKSGVVLRVEKLRGPVAMIFYRFADNDNAPYKDVAIVLTLTLESTDTGSERDSVAYDELRKVWGASLDTDKVEPLLSRIGNSVAFVQPETKEALASLNC